MLNPNNIVTIKTKPVAEVKVGVLNCRSLRNKTASIVDHIIDADVQCLALTDTWLQTSDIDQHVIGEVTPGGYSCLYLTIMLYIQYRNVPNLILLIKLITFCKIKDISITQLKNDIVESDLYLYRNAATYFSEKVNQYDSIL